MKKHKTHTIPLPSKDWETKTADVLREARECAGMTQEELGTAMATSGANVSRKENNAGPVTIGYLAGLAMATGHRLKITIKPMDESSSATSERS
jgi:transcriptional regulator with XRE-family HTH domain